MGREVVEMTDLRVKFVEGVIKLTLKKFSHSFLHGVSQLLCTRDSLDSVHFAELNLCVHELSHALVQMKPATKSLDKSAM